jgi:hypothetical protein
VSFHWKSSYDFLARSAILFSFWNQILSQLTSISSIETSMPNIKIICIHLWLVSREQTFNRQVFSEKALCTSDDAPIDYSSQLKYKAIMFCQRYYLYWEKKHNCQKLKSTRFKITVFVMLSKGQLKVQVKIWGSMHS